MSESHPARDPMEQLAEEWRDRLRRGDRFEADEYVARHPELAEEIRDLFPAIVMMEELKPGAGDLTGAFAGAAAPADGPPRLERLGDFRILREVGRGGMGVVYEAEQESLGRRVALKILPSHALADRHQEKRFHREARATARLHHTNIVPVYGVGQHAGMHYYVMQFIQGAALDQVLAELKRLRKAQSTATATLATPRPALPLPPTASVPAPASEVAAADVARSLLTGTFQAADLRKPKGSGSGPPSTDPPSSGGPEAPPPSPSASSLRLPGQTGDAAAAGSGRAYYLSVARIGIQVAEALAYANSQGIIHRDIKPSNLLLDNQGTVWVTDFGLAKALADGENLTHTGDIVGTLRYMAPERFVGQADARGDIYSLGLTLYELLVQQPAFAETDRNRLIHQVTHQEPAPPRKCNPAIPRDLETIVLKAIDREPARRYATAAALAEDLKRFVQDRPIGARRVGAGERLWRWCRRNPALAGLTAGVALLLLMLAVGATVAAMRFKHLAGQEHKAREKADASFQAAQKAWAAEAQQREEADTAREAAEAAQKKEAEQRAKAVASQRLAEQNFQEARQAIEELLTRVSEGRLKTVPGMQPLRKELLESALKYYQGFVDRHGDDPALKKDLADAYTRVARILAEVGARKEALPIFDKALQIRTELRQREPLNKKLNLDLVAHHQAVGNLHLRLRDWDTALKSLQRAYDILLAFSPQDKNRTANLPLMGTGIAQGIPVHASEDLEVLLAFASVLNDMGAVLQVRDPGEATRIYLQSLYIYRNLPADLQRRPNLQGSTFPLLQQELARQWGRIGNLMSDLEMFASAMTYQQEAKRILDVLSRSYAKHPRFEDFQRELAAARESVGDLHAARKQVKAALAEYRQALVIRQRQALANPAVPDFQSDLANCYFSTALLQARDNSPAQALESLGKAIAGQRTLLAMVPDEKAYVRALARQLMHQARLQKTAGQFEALQSYRQARQLWEKLLFPPESAAGTLALLAPTLEPAPLPALHGLSLHHLELLSAPGKDYLDLAAVRRATGGGRPALEALQQALGAGFKDADLVAATPELLSMGPSEDFQALLQSMKERNRALPWLTDYDQARAQAAREDKDLFLYFGASDWVPSDVAFRKGMLSQAAVVDYLSKHFVPVFLDKTLFSPVPKNFAKTQELLARWKIHNWATMILADPQGRAYWQTDRGSSEVASWGSTHEFLSQLENHRKTRIKRDHHFAEAEKAAGNLDKARHLGLALAGMPVYAPADYADVYERLFQLDRDNRLGLRTRYFDQALAARRAEIRSLLEQRDWKKALQESNAVLAGFAPTGKAGQDVYLDRGFAYLGLGRFERAAADLARGQAVECGNPEYALLQVYALVQLGDVPGYRRVCADLLKHYQNTNNSWHAFLVAWTCSMAPDTLDDWSKPITLLLRFPRDHLRWNALGLLYYRAGNLKQADGPLRTSLAWKGNWRARNELVLALIQQRLGKDKEARQWLDRFHAASTDLEPGRFHASGWRDSLVYQQLLGEAAVLFEGPPLSTYPRLEGLRNRAFMHLGQWDNALAGLGKAIDKEPDNPLLYLERGRCYENLKRSTEAGADYARALELKSLALERARSLFDKSPKKFADRDAFDFACRDLAQTQQRLGRPLEAALTLAHLDQAWAGDGDNLYDAARQLAALLPNFDKGPANLTAAEQAQRRRVADLTVAMLQKAVDAGLVVTDHLKKDAAFQPLYGRADFQEIWKELAQRSKFPLAPGADLRGLDLAVTNQPQNLEPRLERARLLARRGQWHQAIADYDVILPKVAGRAETWIERGRCHALLKQWDQAAADFARALDLLPEHPGFLSPASLACREMAEWEPAFRKTTELRPKYKLLWTGRARYHLLRGQYAQALKDYGRGLEGQPMHDPWYEYAATQALTGDLEGYRKTCRKMVVWASDPKVSFYAFLLARTCSLVPQSGVDAAQIVQGAQRGAADIRFGWNLHVQGAAFYRAGQFKKALPLLEASNRTNWQHGHFLNWFYLALAHHHLGHAGEARAWLDKAIRHMDQLTPAFPGDPIDLAEADWVQAPLLRREAETLLNAPHRREAGESLRKGKWAEAVPHLDALIQKDPEFWPDRLTRGGTHAMLGHWAQAEADFARVLESQTDDPSVWFEHACLLCQARDDAAYRALCSRMRERFDDRKNVIETVFLAHACVLAPGALADPAEVVRLAKERLALTPPPSEHYAWSVHVLALAHYRAGQYDLAVECLTKDPNPWTFGQNQVLNWLVRGLAEHKRGHAAAARRWLDQATNWIQARSRGLPGAGGQVIPPNWLWRDWLLVQQLQREAEQVRGSDDK
jgi:serine/threonine protein kinase